MIIEHRDQAWMMLQQLKEAGPQQRLQLTGDDQNASIVLTNLFRLGFVRYTVDGLMMLTPSGSRKLRLIREALDGPMPIAGKRTYVKAGTYEGSELRRTCLREGAYDAYELPSLMDGKRHYRKEIKA